MTKPTTVIPIDTGLKTFDLKFTDRDEIVQIAFNPTDKGLAIRFKNAQKRIEERLKKFEHIELNADGMPENSDFIDDFEEMTNIVYEELDEAFNSKISEKVFKYCNPLAAVNGNYFFLTFLEAITPIIQEFGEKENKKANENMNKYLDKYGKYMKK